MSDFEQLLEKLRRVEALHARTDVTGEREAAARALEAIRAQLARVEKQDSPIEYSFSMPDSWAKRLFVALLRRYGIQPYRYRGQRRTTVMARVPQSFVKETLWPEFQQLYDVLEQYLSDVTDRVIREAIVDDVSETPVHAKPGRIEKR